MQLDSCCAFFKLKQVNLLRRRWSKVRGFRPSSAARTRQRHHQGRTAQPTHAPQAAVCAPPGEVAHHALIVHKVHDERRQLALLLCSQQLTRCLHEWEADFYRTARLPWTPHCTNLLRHGCTKCGTAALCGCCHRTEPRRGMHIGKYKTSNNPGIKPRQVMRARNPPCTALPS